MDLYRTSVLLHWLLSILIVGQALFWMIMRMSLRRGADSAERGRLLQIVNAARWPHVVVPYRWRLPLPWVTWATLALLVATGIVSMQFRGTPGEWLWGLKLVLVAAVIVVQALLTRRPSERLIGLNFVLVLAIVIMSGWTIR